MKVPVLLNEGAGSVRDSEEITGAMRKGFEDSGVQPEVRVVQGEEVVGAAREAVRAGVDAVVAAGGDGTISAVAGAVANTAVALGVNPLGSANHFAHDVRIPIDPAVAARVVVEGRQEPLDAAERNGRVFINNSLLGLYPDVAMRRDWLDEATPIGKRFAKVLAMVPLLVRVPRLRVRLEVDGDAIRHKTPFLFVGNNAYEMHFFRFGARERLSNGTLFLYTTRASGRARLIRLVLRALFVDVRSDAGFQAWEAAEVVVRTPSAEINVFVDGGVVGMQPPLLYRCLPRALRVILPKR